MPLYCYIVETGYYEDREANILGHTNKYSQEEFDNLVIEITEKYGDVEEIEYTVPATLEHVEEIRYKINSTELIRHLVTEYGFVELEIPVNDGVNSREISRAPGPKENLRKVVVKTPKCPIGEIVYNEPDAPFKHLNARCTPNLIEKGDYCDLECIHYYCDYETRYDAGGCPYDEDISYCKLGHSAIEDASFCKYYEERCC